MTEWLMWQTIATAILGIGTITLAIISIIILKKTLNLNEKILERSELDNRPFFDKKTLNPYIKNTYEETSKIKERTSYEKYYNKKITLLKLKNIGGQTAVIKSINVTVIIDGIVYHDDKIDKIIQVRPGATTVLFTTLDETIKIFKTNEKSTSIEVSINYIHIDDYENEICHSAPYFQEFEIKETEIEIEN